MHLSREMRRFEMEDLSSRRGDRNRSRFCGKSGCPLDRMFDFWRWTIFDSTKTLFVFGLTMVSSGMIQSYYGSVLEIETAKRGWYHLLGIPLIIAMAYVTFISLRDYLTTWYWIVAVVIVTLCLQFAISVIGLRVWNYWQRTSKVT
jgi:hypothetical protein